MGYTYTPSQTTAGSKLNKTAWSLQIINNISTIVNLFISSFLISYIMHINAAEPLSTSLVSVGVYNVSLYIFFGLTYFLASYIVDKTSRIWVFRASLLIRGAFIVLIIFMGKDLAKYVFIAGAVEGVADALYWCSFNVIRSEMVSRVHAEKFATLGSILGKLVSIVFPIIIGYIIDVSTFITMAFYILIIVAVQIGITFIIKAQKPNGSQFNFLDYMKLLKNKTEDVKRIKRVYSSALFYGFKTVMGTIIPILTIYTFKTNLNLGIFTSLASILSIVALIIFNKFAKYGKRSGIYIVLGVLMLASSLLVAFNVTKWTYIIYSFAQTCIYTMFANSLDADRLNIVKKTGHYEYTAEHQFVVEIMFCTSRIIGYVLMIIFGLTLGLLGLQIVVAILGVSSPIFAYFQSRMERNEIRIMQEEKDKVCVQEKAAAEN